MPVQTYDVEATGVDPFRRLSASQVTSGRLALVSGITHIKRG